MERQLSLLLFLFLFLLAVDSVLDSKGLAEWGESKGIQNALSTGKSSNSSSSSSAAAGLTSFVGSVVLLSVVVALVVCGAAPDAGAADMVQEERGRSRGRVGYVVCCEYGWKGS